MDVKRAIGDIESILKGLNDDDYWEVMNRLALHKRNLSR
jgi:hypothetical protein